MKPILDGDGVRVGSVPAYIDIDTHDNKNIIIVGTTGSGKTTFANNLLRGILNQDIPVIACIIDLTNEYSREIRDAGLSVLSLYGNKNTGTTDGMLEDSEIERAVKKHPRAAFHINTRQPAARFEQATTVFRHMLNASPETRKVIVAEDIQSDALAGALLATVSSGKSNITTILMAHYITDSEWRLGFAKHSDVRVVVGEPAKWGKSALDALRISKSDLKGLGRHKALVAAGSKKAIIDAAR